MCAPQLLPLGLSVQVRRTKPLWLNPLQLGFLISLFLLSVPKQLLLDPANKAMLLSFL